MSIFSKIKKGFKNAVKSVGLGGLVGANSIQRSLGNILPVVAGARFGPTAGGIARGFSATDFNVSNSFPIPRTSGLIPPVQGFNPGGLVGPVQAGMSSLPSLMRVGAGLVRTTTGRISRIVLGSGQSFSRKKAASLIRRVGLEAATVALGITIVEAAEILLTEATGRRRRRGITAAQLANAKRVNCTVARMARQLGVKAAPVRRRTACR